MAKGKRLDFQIGADFDDGWGLVEESTAAKSAELLPPEKHMLVFKKEKRRGKPVTIVGPFCLGKGDAAELLKRLKKTLGCGGTQKEEWMEFQGDIATLLADRLSAEGFRLKKRP